MNVLDVQKTWFVGVDTHKHQHTAVAIDAFHQPHLAINVSTRPGHFPSLVRAIAREAPKGVTPVFGLEDTQGLGRSLAQWLLSQGFSVREVNPVYTNRERAHGPDPDKSDSLDAQAIAEVLYRKWSELPQVEPTDRTQALKHLLAVREQLVRQCTMVKNQLHHYLHQQYPGYGDFFYDTFGVTARAFFRRFPSPGHLRRYGVKRLGAFLKKQGGNLGAEKAQLILERVDRLSPRDEATLVIDGLIPTLIDLLGQLEEHMQGIEDRIEASLEQSPYQLRSIPGLGDVLAATLESEIGDIKRFRSADQLARYCGIAPVEDSSGFRSRRKQRRYGKRRFNWAFYLIALGQVKICKGVWVNPRARQYYEMKLAEGKNRKRALRCVMRRLVDIIYAMMRDRSAYRMPRDTSAADPTRDRIGGRRESGDTVGQGLPVAANMDLSP